MLDPIFCIAYVLIDAAGRRRVGVAQVRGKSVRAAKRAARALHKGARAFTVRGVAAD